MTLATKIHAHQTRIGKPTVQGAYFPQTEEGHVVAVYDDKPNPAGPRVGLIVDLATLGLTPREAIALADALRFHALAADPDALK